jgi:uncharacterized protein YbaA (DUF1428 family)
MPYVDGFIVAVPKKKLAAYAAVEEVRQGLARIRRAGLPRMGRRRRQGRQAHLVPAQRQAEAGETVVFAWITYKSRAQRDKINAKVMADPRLKSMMDRIAAAVRQQADDLWRVRQLGKGVGPHQGGVAAAVLRGRGGLTRAARQPD